MAVKKTRPQKAGEQLHRAGMKITRARMQILQILEEAAGRDRTNHLNADEIYRQLLEKEEDVGIATVYRALTQFESAGLIKRHRFNEDQSVYELNQGPHHDHMVCMETGDVVEFVNDKIEELQQEIASSHGYDLVDHSLVLYVRPRESKGGKR